MSHWPRKSEIEIDAMTFAHMEYNFGDLLTVAVFLLGHMHLECCMARISKRVL